MSVTLVALVAIRTYLKVILNLYLDTGKYDHRQIMVAFDYHSPGKWSLTITMSTLISVTAILCIFCYGCIIYTITTVERPDGIGINDVQQKMATKKILAYTFNFLIQWTPTLPFIFGVARGNDPLWIYYLFIISVNIGSIANAIQYICHEGFGITENQNQMILESSSNIYMNSQKKSKRKHSKKKFNEEDDIELGSFHHSDSTSGCEINGTSQISVNIKMKDLEKVKCVDKNFILRGI
ncbi:9671_t:CDS:2 [Funneliformis mosseae]|uniref:9671_t:CDS:1 n=1 Tax=Funneliformis mosseae TaxID=27381 RepID=A0A9N9FRB0_FUNMO|nr:9671_t:CDS:2 [Funneliformis mosseae]